MPEKFEGNVPPQEHKEKIIDERAMQLVEAMDNNDWNSIAGLVETKLEEMGRDLATHSDADYCYLSSPEQREGSIAFSIGVKEALDEYGISVIEMVFDRDSLETASKEKGWIKDSSQRWYESPGFLSRKKQEQEEKENKLKERATQAMKLWKQHNIDELAKIIEEQLIDDGYDLTTHSGADYCYLSTERDRKGAISYTLSAKDALEEFGISVLDEVFDRRTLNEAAGMKYNKENGWEKEWYEA